MTLSWRLASLLVAGLGLTCPGCASPQAPPPGRVVVLRLRGVGIDGPQTEELRRSISTAIGRVTSVVPLPGGETDRAASEVASCDRATQDQDHETSCAVGVGRRLKASHAVVGGAGALGRTRVIQLKLVHVASGSVTRSLEETLFGDFSVMLQATDTVAERLFAVTRRQPWYARWWVWTIVGVGVAAAITVPLVLTRDAGSPYEEITLP